MELPRIIIEFFASMIVVHSIDKFSSLSNYFLDHSVEDIKNKVRHFIKQADLGIIDFTTERIEINKNGTPSSNTPNEQLIKTLHYSEQSEKVAFDFGKQESDGTQLLFSLAYPLINTLEKGLILVIDELDRSLHFKELLFILSLFADIKTNPKNAQIIMTNHNTIPLTALDRNEVYFVDKYDGFSSQLFALSEYESRSDVPFEKRYVEGIYGALPHIGMGV